MPYTPTQLIKWAKSTAALHREWMDAADADGRKDEAFGHYQDVQRLDAIAALLEVQQWQDITTSPENTSVLVYIPNAEHYGEGIYRAMSVNMGTGHRWMTTGRCVGRDLCGESPTHWQPLPAPPVKGRR